MERKIVFAPGEYYHLYNRGVNKGKVFSDVCDYNRFIMMLYLCNSDIPVKVENVLQNKQGLPLLKIKEIIYAVDRGNQILDIGAYCLMPNHFHILVRENVKGGVSKFMLKLTTAYTMYYNKRHARTGALFGGPFQATHACEDSYLKYLFAYIHLNPVKLKDQKWKENGIKNKKEAQQFLDTYTYSSYLDYKETMRFENAILNSRTFPKYFLDITDFAQYVHDWLHYREDSQF